MTAIHDAASLAQVPLTSFAVLTIRFGGGFQPAADIVVADVSGLAPDYDGPLPKDAVRLVVEVDDASLADDLGAKAADYARAGLAEYWVADVNSRTLYLHEGPTEAGYRSRTPVPFGAKIAALTLPLTVSTDSL